MNSRRQKLERRKRRAERRVARRDHRDRGRPVARGNGIRYDVAGRIEGIGVGGIGAVHKIAKRTGLIDEIDRRVHVLQKHHPYHESDHVLNLAYNPLCGGTCLEDIEQRRNDPVYLDAIGADMIPDPTTAGDFCRRFTEENLGQFFDAVDEARLRVWAKQPEEFFERAILDVDGTIVPTCGECKQGMALSFKGEWGYGPLLLSLANTAEPLSVMNRSGNRPSHEGAADHLDRAIALVRRGGFKKVLMRGDTDFTQTAHLDRWDEDGVEFVFGVDAMPNLVKIAESLDADCWERLEREPKYLVQTHPRRKPERVKEEFIREHGYLNLYLCREDVAEFDYKPSKCGRTYRVVAVRKLISVERGQQVLYPEHRYLFYITNLRDAPAAEVVFLANGRCAQEKLIQQLKSEVRAFRPPLDTLMANWAYMAMTSLAWTLKAWFALLLPVSGRWKDRHHEQKRQILTMEFKAFRNALIAIPAQIVRTGRRIWYRLINTNRWTSALLRLSDALDQRMLC